MAPAALILPAAEASVSGTAQALESQSQAPERVLVVEFESALAGALREASHLDPSWVWMIDAGVIPEADALERLLELAASDAVVPPALIVSRVLARNGGLDPDSLPVPEVHRGDRLLAALEHHAVPLRVARRGSILVRHRAVRQLGAGRLLGRDLEWTAQLLKQQPGWLAPASLAVRQEPRRRPRHGELSQALRLLRVLEPRERLWFGAHFGEEAARRVRTGVNGGWTP